MTAPDAPAVESPTSADHGAVSGAAAQQTRYAQAQSLAPAIARLARSVERNGDRARDLEQEIHLALWRSFANFDGRCALATWVYRVAHNVAASHVARDARAPRGVALEALEDGLGALTLTDHDHPEARVGQSQLLARVHALIAQLHLPDRTIMLLYLEGVEASEIAQVTGLSPSHVAVKIHRIKAMLHRHFNMGDKA